MYRCDACGKNSEPKEKCNIVPIKTRVKHYKEGTIGYETVKELKVCNGCKENNKECLDMQNTIISIDS